MSTYMHVCTGPASLGEAIKEVSNQLARSLGGGNFACADLVDAIFDPVVERFVGALELEEANDN